MRLESVVMITPPFFQKSGIASFLRPLEAASLPVFSLGGTHLAFFILCFYHESDDYSMYVHPQTLHSICQTCLRSWSATA